MTKINYPQSNEILFLRGDVNYNEFHLVDGNKIVSSKSLLRHQEKLDGFLRVSRKHLVNLTYVKGVEQAQGCFNIKIVNGNLLKISRRRIGLLKMTLMKQ